MRIDWIADLQKDLIEKEIRRKERFTLPKSELVCINTHNNSCFTLYSTVLSFDRKQRIKSFFFSFLKEQVIFILFLYCKHPFMVFLCTC